MCIIINCVYMLCVSGFTPWWMRVCWRETSARTLSGPSSDHLPPRPLPPLPCTQVSKFWILFTLIIAKNQLCTWLSVSLLSIDSIFAINEAIVTKFGFETSGHRFWHTYTCRWIWLADTLFNTEDCLFQDSYHNMLKC